MRQGRSAWSFTGDFDVDSFLTVAAYFDPSYRSDRLLLCHLRSNGPVPLSERPSRPRQSLRRNQEVPAGRSSDPSEWIAGCFVLPWHRD